ncbi:DUF4244 domain-containing protein [Nonomuraea sp. NPDC050643]|uniref:DUF4244 domain-containing protein n=1 Tax=Nonomuraea sp. NPDC050643 TaxID=3155660 RepID=UPI0033E2A850
MPDDIKATPEAPHHTKPSTHASSRMTHDAVNTSDATRHASKCANSNSRQDLNAAPQKSSTFSAAPRSTTKAWVRSNKWLHHVIANGERGMSTAEYAVGTIAACAFAALLFKVVSSPEVQEMLTSLIDRALNTAKE